jgi:hypothetical protein
LPVAGILLGCVVEFFVFRMGVCKSRRAHPCGKIGLSGMCLAEPLHFKSGCCPFSKAGNLSSQVFFGSGRVRGKFGVGKTGPTLRPADKSGVSLRFWVGFSFGRFWPFGSFPLNPAFAANALRWAAHFLSEGDAAQAQIERIQQAKDAKQTIR